jgi:hypothetical protein
MDRMLARNEMQYEAAHIMTRLARLFLLKRSKTLHPSRTTQTIDHIRQGTHNLKRQLR